MMNSILNLLMMSILLLSCNVFSPELKDQSDFVIPNYSETLPFSNISETYTSSLIAISDDVFLTATQTNDSFIVLLEVAQEYSEETSWSLSSREVLRFAGTKLSSFVEDENGYLCVYQDGDTRVARISSDYTMQASPVSLLDYVNEVYNRSEAVAVLTSSFDSLSQHILLGGYIRSFNEQFPFVMGVGTLSSEPEWLRVYNKGGSIISILSDGLNEFLAVNQLNNDSILLLKDDITGASLQLYAISGQDELEEVLLKSTSQEIIMETRDNNFTSIYRLSIINEQAEIQQVKEYQLLSTDLVIDREDRVVVSGVRNDAENNSAFISELGLNASLWCNVYEDVLYKEVVDIIESPGKGFVILYIVEINNQHRLHMIRIDEEGATSFNSFSEQC